MLLGRNLSRLNSCFVLHCRLKRLDDNSDEIRSVVLRSWLAYAKCLTHVKYDTALYKAHLEAVFKGLMIHLDDPSERIQDAVAEVLDMMASVSPTLLGQFAKNARTEHRSPVRCDALIAKLTSLQVD